MTFPYWSPPGPAPPATTDLPASFPGCPAVAHGGEILIPSTTCPPKGFGIPQNGWVLRWLNPELPRSTLGDEAAIQRLERLLLTRHPPNHPDTEDRIRRARRGQGPALPGQIAGIIREHDPGGNEPEDGIVLELA